MLLNTVHVVYTTIKCLCTYPVFIYIYDVKRTSILASYISQGNEQIKIDLSSTVYHIEVFVIMN